MMDGRPNQKMSDTNGFAQTAAGKWAFFQFGDSAVQQIPTKL
jgi:hypothetical protein